MVSISAPFNLTANYSLTLPNDAGLNGQVLSSDGSGNLNWVTPGGAGSVNSSSIVDGSITDIDINASAAIAQSKIANLGADLAGKQGLNANLTSLSSATLTNNEYLGIDNTGSIVSLSNSVLKSNLALTKTDVGLTNLANDQQIPLSSLNTAITLGTSDSFVPTQNAVKTYVDSKTGVNEIDPKVGVLNSNQWCREQSGKVVCDQPPPAGSPSMTLTGLVQSTPTSGSNYFSTDLGIGTSTPVTKLDVNGEIKVGNSSVSCITTMEGAIRYNSSIKSLEYCDGLNWLSMTHSLHKVVSDTVLNVSSVTAFNDVIKQLENMIIVNNSFITIQLADGTYNFSTSIKISGCVALKNEALTK